MDLLCLNVDCLFVWTIQGSLVGQVLVVVDLLEVRTSRVLVK